MHSTSSYCQKKLAYLLVCWLFFVALVAASVVSVRAATSANDDDVIVVEDVFATDDASDSVEPSVGFFQRLFSMIQQLMRTVLRLQASVDTLTTQQQKHQQQETKEPPASPTTPQRSSIAGTYRCWSYHVSGGAGNCRIAPSLVLHADGRYEMSSEHGTYRVSGDVVTCVRIFYE